MAPVGGQVLQAEPTEWFAGTADWPCIDALMHDRSLAMIATKGIPAWLGFGGLLRDDGLLSFGSASNPALKILNEQCASPGGILWTDGSGTTWAVCPSRPAPDNTDRPAFACSWHGNAWLFGSGARRWAIRRLETRMTRARRPGRAWSQADRLSYARWARTSRQLRLVDLAMRLLAALGDRQGCVEFTVADLDWSLSPAATDDATPNVAEVWAAACATTALQVAELRLGQLGFDPRVVRQSVAVTQAFRVSADSFELQISDLWSAAVAAFADSWPPTA
jgi:hypothetical protein